jgi:hypothetical protein
MNKTHLTQVAVILAVGLCTTLLTPSGAGRDLEKEVGRRLAPRNSLSVCVEKEIGRKPKLSLAGPRSSQMRQKESGHEVFCDADL